MTRRKSLGVGSVSLILIFCVLCLTIFALLTLSSARSENALARKLAVSVENFYAADIEALEVCDELRAALSGGDMPDEVRDLKITYLDSEEGFIVGFAAPIDDNRSISVTAEFADDGLEIVSWKEVASDEWQPDLGLPVLTIDG